MIVNIVKTLILSLLHNIDTSMYTCIRTCIRVYMKRESIYNYQHVYNTILSMNNNSFSYDGMKTMENL